MNCTSLLRDSKCKGASKLCLPDGICICDSGWITLNAFTAKTGDKCNINEDGIRGLSIIEAIFSSIYLLIILRHLVKRFLVASTFKAFLKDLKTLCAFIFLLIGVSDIILALSYQSYRRQQVYQSGALGAASSALFTFLCFVGLSIYFKILLNFLRDSKLLMNAKNRNNVISRLTVMQRLSWLVVPLSIPISLSPVFAFLYRNYAEAFARTLIIGIGLLLLLYVILYVAALGFMINELSSHIESFGDLEISGESHDLHLVLRKLNSAYYVGGAFLLSGSAAMVLFGSLDFLLQKFPYLGIIVRFNGIVVFTLLHLTIAGIPVPAVIITKKVSFVGKFFRRCSFSSLDKRVLPTILLAVEERSENPPSYL